MSADTIFDKLSRFCREDKCADFFDMAQETFWEDIIDLTGIDDFDSLREMLGPHMTPLAEINLTGFFVSNDYQQHPDPTAPRWNAVECFLACNAGKLTPEDERFLIALRQSHMSLYRIIETKADNTVKLWDMIDETNVTVQVGQELFTRLNPKETWGFRLLKTDDTPRIMVGALPIKESAARNVASAMKKIHAKFMRHMKTPEAKRELGRTSEAEINHLARVMWAPEISTAYIAGEMARIGKAIMESKDLRSSLH